MKKNILITGTPRSGKSTLLKKVIAGYQNKVGFITNEIREKGERVGFEIETHLGETAVLAHVNFKTSYKVSRYFVDTDNLDAIIPKVKEFSNDKMLFLDEIGQMELFSEKFRQLVLKYFNSPNSCIATLSKVYSDEFTEKIKTRNDIILIEISEENRELKQEYINALLSKIAKARKYMSEPSRFTVNANRVAMRTDHGTRNLTETDQSWTCDCAFFNENKICSHVIALEGFLSTAK